VQEGKSQQNAGSFLDHGCPMPSRESEGLPELDMKQDAAKYEV
jgi:hypothetical protein